MHSKVKNKIMLPYSLKNSATPYFTFKMKAVSSTEMLAPMQLLE